MRSTRVSDSWHIHEATGTKCHPVDTARTAASRGGTSALPMEP
jgi:hypothetical protein